MKQVQVVQMSTPLPKIGISPAQSAEFYCDVEGAGVSQIQHIKYHRFKFSQIRQVFFVKNKIL